MKYYELSTKKDKVALIREKLKTDRNWALRGLLVIYDNQTEDEKNVEQTVEHNGIGFTGADAEFLSSLASQYRRKGYLSTKQLSILFKKIPKYASQLQKMAELKNKEALDRFNVKFS